MNRIYAFHDCRLDPARRLFWRAGRPVPLAPQTFDFLAYLLDHHQRPVGRDEIAAAVWKSADVSDAHLDQVAERLRHELGDATQCLLRTIPHFGYHWVAPLIVTGSPTASPAAAAPENPAAGAPSRTGTAARPRRALSLVLGLVLLLIVVALLLGFHRQA